MKVQLQTEFSKRDEEHECVCFLIRANERHKNGHVTDAAPQSSHFHLKKKISKNGKLIIALFWYFIINSKMLFNWIWDSCLFVFFCAAVCDCLYQSKHKSSEYNSQPQNMHHDLLLCATLSWFVCIDYSNGIWLRVFGSRIFGSIVCHLFNHIITKFLSYALFMR